MPEHGVIETLRCSFLSRRFLSYFRASICAYFSSSLLLKTVGGLGYEHSVPAGLDLQRGQDLNADKIQPETRSKEELLQEIVQLKSRLEATQETLNAVEKGEVNALMIPGGRGEQIFTLHGDQEPYRIFVDTMNEGAAMVAADGTIVYGNTRFAEMLGTPLEKVIGSPFQRFVFQTDRPILEELQEREGMAGYRREHALKASNGVLVPVYLSARVMKAGESENLCIIVTDITERKFAEERLLRSEQQLRLIFDQLPAAIWTTDSQLRILSASGAALVPSNLRTEDLTGKTVQEFFGNQNEQSSPLAAHLAALKGKFRSFDYNLTGNIFSIGIQPLRNADGEITGVIGVGLDVTESKRRDLWGHPERLYYKLEPRRGTDVWLFCRGGGGPACFCHRARGQEARTHGNSRKGQAGRNHKAF
jgi:PAS domain S-box-containing protein